MLSDILNLLLGLLVIAIIIAANGFFVAQEFAYMSVDRSRLGAQADAGDATAQRALSVTRRTSFMLSGAQLGITITGLLVGFVAEPLVGQALAGLLGDTGIPAAVSITVGTVLALAVSTIVQMIFGELYPKNLAIANPEPLARALARPTVIYLAAFGWLITVFDHAANGLLKLLRIEPVHDVDSSATAADLEHIVADSRNSGDLPAELSMIIDRILDFPTEDVEHAMVPRGRVGTVEPHTTIAEVRILMAREHTRYPVIGDNDEPVGTIQLVDVLRAPQGATIADVMREPTVVPTLMSLPDALAAMTADKNQLACVVDEYGGFAGILTMEDLAEEIVGEITDEHDDEVTEYVEPEGTGMWRMSGDVHIDEAERAIGHDLPEGDYETIAGLIIAEHGSLPDEGDVITIDIPDDPADSILDQPISRYIDAQILAVERHVPAIVRIVLREETVTNDEEVER
ncbi:hemolysin family protein [Jonesia quinghaiensis]|uniref:hemolysin family protein n=1 Tax=Jonesia quinghaiensis TaxID=262806 RepID=UPI00041F372B|nr:hemolysin family protein [Jonesia quinghaiensis]